MSVVKGKRKENDLQVIRSLRELAIHTIVCCCNESVFPKSKRWLYTQRITNEAVDALLCATRAKYHKELATSLCSLIWRMLGEAILSMFARKSLHITAKCRG